MTSAVHRSSVRGVLRRAAGIDPGHGVLVAVGLSWVVLILGHLPSGDHAVHGAHGAHGAAHGTRSVGVLGSLPPWTLMCVAMMLPAAVPAVRHVAANTLRWRRQRAAFAFVTAYLVVWTAYGAVALAALALVGQSATSDRVLVGTLGAAAVWQLLPYQRRAVRACHRTVPLPPRGWPALAGCLQFGLRQGMGCVGVCGPLMLVMAALPPHGSVAWMPVVALVSVGRRLTAWRRPWDRALAAVLGGAAVLVLLS